MLRVLLTAAITARLLVTAAMMIVRPRSLLQHKKVDKNEKRKSKKRENHHKNLCYQFQRIFPPKKIQLRKVISVEEAKATDFKLYLNLKVKNWSFMVKWQVMSIASLSVLFQKWMQKRIFSYYSQSLRIPGESLNCTILSSSLRGRTHKF